MSILIFYILGLLVGSFLNVLVRRLHAAEEMFFSRSKCPHCKNLIRWHDNIPVLSFVLLRFRCRDCRKKISWVYPTIEILTGVAFALAGWKFFEAGNFETWAVSAYYLFILSSLIAILLYDWLYMEIPASILNVSIFAAVAFNLWIDWNDASFLGTFDVLESQTYGGVLAAFIAFTFFFSLSFFSRERWMGMGDAYLAVLLGLVVGWPQILLALFLAFFLGAFYGIIMLSLGKKKMKSQLPFAPFMILGAMISLFFYFPIVDWYWSIFI